MLSIFLLLDHNKPDWSSGKKRKPKRSYFLCYELEKVKKEEVDLWTYRHERVNRVCVCMRVCVCAGRQLSRRAGKQEGKPAGNKHQKGIQLEPCPGGACSQWSLTLTVPYKEIWEEIYTSSIKELYFKMRMDQSQILTMQYVNSRHHTGKGCFRYTAVWLCEAVENWFSETS